MAIKEGVYKSLQITDEHFRALYSGTPFEYFLYDSAKLGQVRNFATSAQIQIMVVTVGAINKKDINNLYKDSEKTGGEKPIDLIRTTTLFIPSFYYQMTPKVPLNTRCSISISKNLSINGRTRSSDQLGIWSYNINP